MTPARSRRAALLVAALALLAGGCSDSEASTPDLATSPTASSYALPECPELPRQEPVPDGLPALRLPCLGGGPAVRLSDLRGTPMVLNVWAAWCVNCDREMPLFGDAMARAGTKVRFFGVHYKAAEKYGEQSAADFGVPFPSVHDEDGDKVARALRATAPPQTLFVSADGKVMGREVGEITSQAELDGLVRRYLGVRL
jgi:cytochrome c biogenesis protein CcmG/thiol:disulfide interchange protein DsbE